MPTTSPSLLHSCQLENVYVKEIYNRLYFMRKKCDETKPECLRCLSSGKPCTYEYIEYSKGDSHWVKRTKPAPRSIPTSLLDANLGSSSTLLISRESAVLDLSPYLPLIPPVPSQLLTGVNTINSSLTPLDLVRLPASVPHAYDMAPVASNSTLPRSTSLDDEDEDDPEGIRALLCIVPTLDKNVKENSLPFVLCCCEPGFAQRRME
ncbi:unnamed protein product [Rhizoctonia solani]|uniref:Zn(2)-C6 fungal-type domain-containing protein n=1 Tax=Rhizoctonia solani TaxID=456999 RepID=A0A8H3H228_9AGAM|nr:unnamed protein product [Rhizoctonia solani]